MSQLYKRWDILGISSGYPRDIYGSFIGKSMGRKAPWCEHAIPEAGNHSVNITWQKSYSPRKLIQALFNLSVIIIWLLMK
jgi:hypothetical protein